MKRPSPPTDRVVGVLGALMTHGALSAAEIGRRVGISPATCVAILAGLTDAGYLVRDPATRAFRLGPALVPLGRAAARTFPLAAVRDELEVLHARLGLVCFVAVATDDAIVVIDQIGQSASTGAAGPARLRAGQQVPLAPPFGAIYLAWDDRERQEAWSQRAPAPLRKRERAELRQVLDDNREAGYAVPPYDENGARLRMVLAQIASDALAPSLRAQTRQLLAELHGHDYLQSELDSHPRVAVNTITAPVFGPNGRRAFAQFHRT